MPQFCLSTFNVNGLRARFHQLHALIEAHNPDLIALQEIKVEDSAFPKEAFEGLPYHVIYLGQKANHGVAVLTKIRPSRILKGFEPFESHSELLNTQARLLEIELETPLGPLHFLNGYFPNGENQNHPDKFPFKAKFYQALTERLKRKSEKGAPLIVVGDMNIAPEDRDIGIGEENRKRWLKEGHCAFLPLERQWIQSLEQGGGLLDCHRKTEHSPEAYSWFDYRSKGFERDPRRGLRIDLVLATPPWHEKTKESLIDYTIRGMERPSDHAPVVVRFEG